MTNDRPENYAPPKVREQVEKQQETEMLRAVNSAVSDAAEAVEPKVQDFAMLGAQAILKYAEASAKSVEQTGDEVLGDANRLRDECYGLAEDIRYVARIKAQAVQRAMDRNREAAQGVTALRKMFHEDIAKEQAELDAAKQRASS